MTKIIGRMPNSWLYAQKFIGRVSKNQGLYAKIMGHGAKIIIINIL